MLRFSGNPSEPFHVQAFGGELLAAPPALQATPLQHLDVTQVYESFLSLLPFAFFRVFRGQAPPPSARVFRGH